MKLITKGSYFYEIQFLAIVLQWLYTKDNDPIMERGITIGRLHIWWDKQWTIHGWPYQVRCFWRDLTVNLDKFKSLDSKWHILRFNARHMYRRWYMTQPAFESYRSLRAYLRLHKAGFSISNSKMESTDFEINRFYWKGRVIREMPDIDKVKDHYNTIHNGHVELLGHSEIRGLTPDRIWSEEWESKKEPPVRESGLMSLYLASRSPRQRKEGDSE